VARESGAGIHDLAVISGHGISVVYGGDTSSLSQSLLFITITVEGPWGKNSRGELHELTRQNLAVAGYGRSSAAAVLRQAGPLSHHADVQRNLKGFGATLGHIPGGRVKNVESQGFASTPSNLYHSIMRSPSQITPVTRRIFGTLFLLNFTLLSAAMAGKTGFKAKWRHLTDLPHSGARHPIMVLPYPMPLAIFRSVGSVHGVARLGVTFEHPHTRHGAGLWRVCFPPCLVSPVRRCALVFGGCALPPVSFWSLEGALSPLSR